MIVEFIAQRRGEHGVEPICTALKDTAAQIAPSTVWARLSPVSGPSARAAKDAALMPVIRQVHAENLGVYGARKVHAALQRTGIAVARCTVERPMRADGLAGIGRAKSIRTTFSAGAQTPRPVDLVEREFVAEAPNELWVADITYIRTHAGWVYAAFVLDVFSRLVVGWQASTTMHTELALDALDMGLWSRTWPGSNTTRIEEPNTGPCATPNAWPGPRP